MPYNTRSRSRSLQQGFQQEQQPAGQQDNRITSNQQQQVSSQESYAREQPEYFAAYTILNDLHNGIEQQGYSQYNIDDGNDDEAEQNYDSAYNDGNTLTEKVEHMLEKLASKVSGGNTYGNGNGW